jgi:glycine cleavage system H protein
MSSEYPSDLKYTKDHEWARIEGDKVRVGVTAYAVESLGDVTMVTFPPVGSELAAAARFGEIESVKAVSELFSPISGTIVASNDAIDASPEIVNNAPYGDGWLLVLSPANLAELDGLMDAAAYESYVKSLDH